MQPWTSRPGAGAEIGEAVAKVNQRWRGGRCRWSAPGKEFRYAVRSEEIALRIASATGPASGCLSSRGQTEGVHTIKT